MEQKGTLKLCLLENFRHLHLLDFVSDGLDEIIVASDLARHDRKHLPDLTDEQIEKQIAYAISKGWAMNVEWTDDPHPRNSYWELWGLPLFDIQDAASVMFELRAARDACPEGYIRMNAFDASYGTESCVMAFIVGRPSYEPGFFLERTDGPSRMITYRIRFKYSWRNEFSILLTI